MVKKTTEKKKRSIFDWEEKEAKRTVIPWGVTLIGRHYCTITFILQINIVGNLTPSMRSFISVEYEENGEQVTKEYPLDKKGSPCESLKKINDSKTNQHFKDVEEIIKAIVENGKNSILNLNYSGSRI